MKKTIIKIAVFLLTFLVALIVLEKVMNKSHDNMTMQMAEASLPVITMKQGNFSYNMLFGYKEPRDVVFERDQITVLGENREVAFQLNPHGQTVEEVEAELRSADGSRLVEQPEVKIMSGSGEKLEGRISLKDLLDPDETYSLSLAVCLPGGEKVYFYTQVLWNSSLHLDEKMDFVRSFHSKIFDKTEARDLTMYMETNAQLEKNQSFHKVNIHSSFQQITWGDLGAREVGDPVITLVDIGEQTATFLVDYYVQVDGVEDLFRVKEEYRLRLGTERIFLLGYERTMTQIVNVQKMYGNDKILLGIADENTPLFENADGSVVVFVSQGRLLSYNVTTNKMAVLFGFYDEENWDERTLHDAHSIKVLDVDEGGNVSFAVYGYMNRGRHEGEVGIQIYTYSSSMNAIEEQAFIPYDKSAAVLEAEMDTLLYENREQQLYLYMENTVLQVDLAGQTCEKIVQVEQDESMHVSDNHRIVVWQEGHDLYHSLQLHILDLESGTSGNIDVRNTESAIPLGFMGEDIIYGVARQEDIVVETSGRVLFPMYKVCICDTLGMQLKEYSQPGIYITGCQIQDNQITLKRLQKTESGYVETMDDQITTNKEEVATRNRIVVATIDKYESYVQIQTKNNIDTNSIQVLTPKEIVYEGGRDVMIPSTAQLKGENGNRYYVYGGNGIEQISNSPAVAVKTAYEANAVVVDETGDLIWRKGNRMTKNQIMAIKATSVDEDHGSLAVCLDQMLRLEGVVKDTQKLLQSGQSAKQILANNLGEGQVLDLSGCDMDALLYYVNMDIPVLTFVENGEAVLITGFNEYNVVILEPSTGKLYKKGIKDSAAWFAQGGNRFITYTR